MTAIYFILASHKDSRQNNFTKFIVLIKEKKLASHLVCISVFLRIKQQLALPPPLTHHYCYFCSKLTDIYYTTRCRNNLRIKGPAQEHHTVTQVSARTSPFPPESHPTAKRKKVCSSPAPLCCVYPRDVLAVTVPLLTDQ